MLLTQFILKHNTELMWTCMIFTLMLMESQGGLERKNKTQKMLMH